MGWKKDHEAHGGGWKDSGVFEKTVEKECRPERPLGKTKRGATLGKNGEGNSEDDDPEVPKDELGDQ